jgi:hypothetical protein
VGSLIVCALTDLEKLATAKGSVPFAVVSILSLKKNYLNVFCEEFFVKRLTPINGVEECD